MGGHMRNRIEKQAIRFILCFSLFLFLPLIPAYAVEVAPRISDREILERLSRLEEGQEQFQIQMNQRFESVDQRFDAMSQQMNQQFVSVDQRFDDLKWFLGTMLGILMVMNSAVLGYVLKRQGKVESSLETIRDEVAFLKSVIERLLPAKP